MSPGGNIYKQAVLLCLGPRRPCPKKHPQRGEDTYSSFREGLVFLFNASDDGSSTADTQIAASSL